MQVREIQDREEFDNFILTHGGSTGSFLQSWMWGEFQKEYGSPMWRLGVFDGNELVAVALIVKHQLPLGKSYLYCPKGPVLKVDRLKLTVDGKIFETLFEKTKEIGEQENAIFFRFEPNGKKDEFAALNLASLKKTKPVQPAANLILSLKDSEDEILNKMKPKTRYNIRLAEKHGVGVRTSHSVSDVHVFFDLAQVTARRNKFRTHPKVYFEKMVEVFSKEHPLTFYIAEYQGKVLAMNLMLTFGKAMTYLHGASSEEYQNVMAPHLLHWRAIQDAKKQGLEHYDFGGISTDEFPEPKWPGMTRFKLGFGGEVHSSAGTFDKVLQSGWYSLYRLAKAFR